jgi:hypothetical protein
MAFHKIDTIIKVSPLEDLEGDEGALRKKIRS